MSDIEIITLAWSAASIPVIAGLAWEIHLLRRRIERIEDRSK